MKRILIPTDFSLCALNAAFYAFEIFREKDVEFFLLHSYIAPGTSPEMIENTENLIMEESKVSLLKEINKIKRFTRYSKLKITPIYKYGDVEYAVKKVVQQQNIDTIVMGTTGSSGIKKILLGSNAYAVAKNLELPVWVVPEKASLSKPKNILLATDLKTVENFNILNPLIELVKNFNSSVDLLNVYNQKENKKKEINLDGIELFQALREKNIKHAYHLHTENESIEDGILNFIKENETDLLVLVKRHYSFVENLFHHSVTRELAFHSTVPLLILHN